MAWENIEQRIKHAFNVEIRFPSGTVWLPGSPANIDEWLTTAASSSEELNELNIPRIRFLQNRWPIEKLVEFGWDDAFSSRRAVWVMYVGVRGYILFSDGVDYQLIAAVEPKDEPSLYRAVIGKLLQNPKLKVATPVYLVNSRPDLLGDIFAKWFTHADRDYKSGVLAPPQSPPLGGGENFGGLGGPVNWMRPGSPSELAPPTGGYLSKVLARWIGAWIDLPALGYPHEEAPDFFSSSAKGGYVMNYKPSYGDKQRDAQKRRKQEQEAPHQQEDTEAGAQQAAHNPTDRKPGDNDKHAA